MIESGRDKEDGKSLVLKLFVVETHHHLGVTGHDPNKN